MKRKVIVAGILLGIFSTTELSAQKYLGLSNSNYSGVYGGQYSPAKVADKKVRLSVNLISVNAMLDNDYYKFTGVDNFKDLGLNTLGQGLSYDAGQKRLSFGVIGETLAPSFQFTTGDRLGFGFSSRIRTFAQGDNINSDFINVLNKNFKNNIAIKDDQEFSLNANGILDLGVKGAYTVVDNDKLRLSLGAALKYYRGLAYNSFISKNYDLTYNYNPINPNINLNNIDWEFYTNLDNENLEETLRKPFSSPNAGTGFGGDFGAELELKGNNTEKPYDFKFGVAVNDIGSIKYKNLNFMSIKGSGVNIDAGSIDLLDLNSTADYLQSKGLSVVRSTNRELTTSLPTNLNVYGDYAITKKFFISANASINVVKTNSTNPYYYNFVGVAPRFESKWFDVSVPLSYNLMSKDFKPGLAFRVGPLSLGSDDLKLLFTESKGANAYLGLHFELFKKQAKAIVPPVESPIDSDGDGVFDKDDACPDVAGPVENNGCPWPDTDGDGVLDKDDACPDVAGAIENNGCPWPDTDGDGVLDKDDKCPTVPGLASNQGCPKAHETVAKEVTFALKDILFNFGKATINPESNKKLDTAAKIIKDSKGGTYLLVGHTDKKGNEAYNLKLSRERAAAVVQALEERGVPADQLKSKGVGSKEATTPATASDAERQKDRRVEVLHITGSEWEALSKSDVPVAKKKVATSAKGKAPAKKAPVRKVAPKKKK